MQPNLASLNKQFVIFARLLDRVAELFQISHITPASSRYDCSFIHLQDPLVEKYSEPQNRPDVLRLHQEQNGASILIFRGQEYTIQDESDIDTIFPPGMLAEERLKQNEKTWVAHVAAEHSVNRGRCT
jgi:hypothetical protein